jgi:CRP/FNR family cyclic AMP-dependent transcriptional regulator
VAADLRSAAEVELIAPLITLQVGDWHADLPPEGAGLLVLEGLLIRRVGFNGRYGAEVLGEGDLLRPWQGRESVSSLTPATHWRVLEPTKVAVLDARVTLRLARYPQLLVALIDRTLGRARALATLMAITQQSGVETRLAMLLWLLADRWGRVRPDGTLLELSLTHETLSELVAARRPTVSTAMAELARQNLVTRTPDGFLLGGDPPRELLEFDL